MVRSGMKGREQQDRGGRTIPVTDIGRLQRFMGYNRTMRKKRDWGDGKLLYFYAIVNKTNNLRGI